METRDWTRYGEVYAAEKAAYASYRDEQSPPDGAHVRPTRVKAAKQAWYRALDERYKLEELIALQLGLRRYEVPMLYLKETTTQKEVKR